LKYTAMHRGVSPTAMKEATSYFLGVWVISSCLREFQLELMLEDVENLIDREVQRSKGDGAFGFRRR